jgi:hypothetical protein
VKQGKSKGAEAVESILHGQLLAVLSDIEKQSPSELPSDTSTQYDQVTATRADSTKEK